jgi:two-component system, NtrC family, nitrogen regulation response regulator NtrX
MVKIRKKRPEHNILIVDDDKDMCLSLADVISLDDDCAFEFSTNPKNAIAMARAKDYSLIIIDYKMPVMNGIEVLRALKKIKAETPVIMLTAFLSTELVEEAHKEGIAIVLSKFIWPDELLRQVSTALKK